MCCEDVEIKILDYQENRLSPAEREAVAAHLAGCAGCRTLARQLQQLDAALVEQMEVPVLSAGFDRRLRERIQSLPADLLAAQRAERQRQLQAEFESGLVRLRREMFSRRHLLNLLIRPALAVLAGWLAWVFTSPFTAHLNAQSLGGVAPSLLPWLAASMVFLAVGLGDWFARRGNALR